MSRRRRFTTFNLAFLDIMSCGFGAVILVFLIIDHSIEVQANTVNEALLSEVNLLEEDVSDGEDNLVRLHNTLSDADFQMVTAQGLASRITDQIDEFRALLQSLEADGFTDRSEIELLQAEILKLEEEVKKLQAAAEDSGGQNAREFIGDGDRQYLTGLNLGGRRILILLDVSSSMLAEEIVNIIRLRNMGDEVKRQAAKWLRMVNTVDWLLAQLPLGSRYQLVVFNAQARPVLQGTQGSWLEVSDQEQLQEVMTALRTIIPSGGTSLQNAIAAMHQLAPLPDNVFLITDGLPTQGATKPRKRTVSGAERVALYNEAVKQIPRNIPFNIILAPMEGDPAAASVYWQLAQHTQGSFLSPSKDWP